MNIKELSQKFDELYTAHPETHPNFNEEPWKDAVRQFQENYIEN